MACSARRTCDAFAMIPRSRSRLRYVVALSVLVSAGLVANACSLNPQPLPPDAPRDAGGAGYVPVTTDSGGSKGGGGGQSDATNAGLDSGAALGTTDGAAPAPPSDAASEDGQVEGGPEGGRGEGGPDSAITDAGTVDGALGAPCTTDLECAGALCLGGAFTGGYCSAPVIECDPGGSACGDAGLCTKSGAVDVDGAAEAEFCLVTCQGQADCRQGYSCCYGATYAETAGLMVCVPPSLCPDQ
jgi:hypothetical protein